MQFRVQFLEGSARVGRSDAARAISLVANLDWPLRAVSMRVIDLDGRVVIEGDTPRK